MSINTNKTCKTRTLSLFRISWEIFTNLNLTVFQMMCKRLLFLACVFILSGTNAQAQPNFQLQPYPIRVIFDTDFGPDYDDVGAITLLHSFADSGYIRILATIASSKHKNVAAAINVFNTYFNRPEIPIGVVSGKALGLGDHQHWTDTVINRYPHRIKNNADAQDALLLYRKLLAAQPDHSVTIITVGFLTNLANLLDSKNDQYSPLNGYDLVKRKVSRLVSMAGRFPSGGEFNLNQDIGSSGKVLASWPTPILFSGFEIGWKIRTGLPLIHNDKIHDSPVKDVFAICIPMAAEDSAGRMSWDESAVFVAVKGWQKYYDLEPGECRLDSNGVDTWIKSGTRQARLVEKISPQTMSEILNQLIMHQPIQSAGSPPGAFAF
jgi:pyrimidine-specific ribonucleoside hydrolase